MGHGLYIFKYGATIVHITICHKYVICNPKLQHGTEVRQDALSVGTVRKFFLIRTEDVNGKQLKT